MLVVKPFGLNPLCFCGRIPTRSLYWLRRRAMIVSSILLACTTSEIPLKLLHSVRSLVLLSTMMMAYFHCCGTSLPSQYKRLFRAVFVTGYDHRWLWSWTAQRNHRTHRSRMRSTYSRSITMFTFSYLTYTKLRSRFPSRSIVFRCLHVAFWTRLSGLRTKVQRRLRTAVFQAYWRFVPVIFTSFWRLLLYDSTRTRLLASSLCCHASFISASTPGPGHQPYAPRRRIEHGASLTTEENITSAMSMVTSLLQVPSRIDGTAAIIAFANWHRKFGLVINHLRSQLFRFGANLRGMGTFAYSRFWYGSGASKSGRWTLTQRTSRRSAFFVRIRSTYACPLLRLALWNV